MAPTIADIINDIAAAFEGYQSTGEYAKSHEKGIAKLADIEKRVAAVRVLTLEDYREASKLASAVSSLYCFAFNNQSPEFKRVAALDLELGKKLLRFAERFDQAKDGKIRALIKYVCWNRWFMRHDASKIAQTLLQHSHLFSYYSDNGDSQKWKGHYVTGLHLQVGDNVFTPDGRGRYHRCFNKSWSLQAFSVSETWHTLFDKMETNGEFVIPLLPNYYERVYFGGGRHQARLMFTRRDQRYIEEGFLLAQ